MPNAQIKIQTITLTTTVNNQGRKCVNRNPGQLVATRKDIDIVRVINGNTVASNDSIDVELKPSFKNTADHPVPPLFDGSPAKFITLDPGEHVDWMVRANLSGNIGVKFQTDPDNCIGHDQDDIVINGE